MPCPVLSSRIVLPSAVSCAGYCPSTFAVLSSRIVLLPEIKYKKPHSWYKLYCNCGFLSLISGCTLCSALCGADLAAGVSERVDKALSKLPDATFCAAYQAITLDPRP
eukprot:1140461-Rhodomonas_salina.3